MKFAVLGAGFQGTACAYDLLRFAEPLTEVTLVDAEASKAEQAVNAVQQMFDATHQPADEAARRDRVTARVVDVTCHEALVGFLQDYDVVVSAVPYFLNLDITRAAIEAKAHMIDMGGNTDLVFQQRELSAQAQAAGVTILPDGGLAPGMANVLAVDGIQQLAEVDRVCIRVGGLPQYPQGALNYQLFFSIHGLINEYLGTAVVLREGRRVEVPTLTGLERLKFTDTDEELEAFITLGGLSTLPWTYEGKVKSMDYKTIRYPGHCDQIRALQELGLLEEAPVDYNGAPISPREFFIQQALPRLTREDNHDIVLVRVQVEGTTAEGRADMRVYELIDRYDETTALTAMMRCTAFPVSIIAQMMADGTITQRGVLGLEEVVPTGRFIEALKRRDIDVQVREVASV